VTASFAERNVARPAPPIAITLSRRAVGASAGLVGTIGIQIRAERIDANAAQSMQQSGILHAGFYGELEAGWVNGFGKATKLDVGDTTWFAGVDFEF